LALQDGQSLDDVTLTCRCSPRDGRQPAGATYGVAPEPDGTRVFAGLEPGLWYVTATMRERHNAAQEEVEVTEGTLTPLDLVLAPTTNLLLTVTQPDGQPLAEREVQVDVAPEDRPEEPWAPPTPESVRTDARAQTVLAGVPATPGTRMRLTVQSDAGYAVVPFETAGPETEVPVTLGEWAAVEGTITEASARLPGEAWVVVSPWAQVWDADMARSFGDSGYGVRRAVVVPGAPGYRVERLRAGRQYVSLVGEGLAGDTVPVTLADGDVATVDLEAAQGGLLSVSVRDREGALTEQVQISARQEAAELYASPAATPQPGICAFPRLAAGQWLLYVRKQGYAPVSRRVTVEDGSEQLLEVTLVQGGTLRGALALAPGTTLPQGAYDAQLERDGLPTHARVGADGTFRFTGLEPGRYTLGVHRAGETELVVQWGELTIEDQRETVVETKPLPE